MDVWFHPRARSSTKNTLGFLEAIPRDEISDFPKYLDKAVGALIMCISECGGLMKHLPDAAVTP